MFYISGKRFLDSTEVQKVMGLLNLFGHLTWNTPDISNFASFLSNYEWF